MDWRTRTAGLPKHLAALPGIEADVYATALFVDQLVEFHPAVSDTFGGLEIAQAVDVEIGGVAQGVGRGRYAADRGVDLGIAIGAGDFDRPPEQRSHGFSMRSASRFRFSRCAGVGSFLTPIDRALLEIVNSSSEKCALSFMAAPPDVVEG
jgi:hypothetical protein